MIGVIAGDGIGVGNSRIGDKHLLILLGISSRIVGGHNKFVPEDALWAAILSSTGTSIADCRWKSGESGAVLEKLIGVCASDDVSSSAGSINDVSSGVVDCDTIIDEGRFTPALDEAKFLNIANIESALVVLVRTLDRTSG